MLFSLIFISHICLIKGNFDIKIGSNDTKSVADFGISGSLNIGGRETKSNLDISLGGISSGDINVNVDAGADLNVDLEGSLNGEKKLIADAENLLKTNIDKTKLQVNGALNESLLKTTKFAEKSTIDSNLNGSGSLNERNGLNFEFAENEQRGQNRIGLEGKVNQAFVDTNLKLGLPDTNSFQFGNLSINGIKPGIGIQIGDTSGSGGLGINLTTLDQNKWNLNGNNNFDKLKNEASGLVGGGNVNSIQIDSKIPTNPFQFGNFLNGSGSTTLFNTTNPFGGLNSKLSINWTNPSWNFGENLNLGVNGTGNIDLSGGLNIPKIQNNIGISPGDGKNIQGTHGIHHVGGVGLKNTLDLPNLSTGSSISDNVAGGIKGRNENDDFIRKLGIGTDLSLGLQGNGQLQEQFDNSGKNNFEFKGNQQLESGAESVLQEIENLNKHFETELKGGIQLPQWKIGTVGTENVNTGIHLQLPDIKGLNVGENLNIKSGLGGDLSLALKDDLKNLQKFENGAKAELHQDLNVATNKQPDIANPFGGLTSKLNFNSTNWKMPSLTLGENPNLGINGSLGTDNLPNFNGFKLDVPGLNWGKMNGTVNIDLTGGLNIPKIQNNIKTSISEGENILKTIEMNEGVNLKNPFDLPKSNTSESFNLKLPGGINSKNGKDDFIGKLGTDLSLGFQENGENNLEFKGTQQLKSGAELILQDVENLNKNLETELKAGIQLPKWNIGTVGTENVNSGINFHLPDMKGLNVGDNLNVKSELGGDLSLAFKDDLKNLQKFENGAKTELQDLNKATNENTASLSGGLNSKLNFNLSNWTMPTLNLGKSLNSGINGSVKTNNSQNFNEFKLEVPGLQGLNWGKMNDTGNIDVTGELNIPKIQDIIGTSLGEGGNILEMNKGEASVKNSLDLPKLNLGTELKTEIQLPQWNIGTVGTENVNSKINLQLPDIKGLDVGGENLNIKSGFGGDLSLALKDDLKNLQKFENEAKTKFQDFTKATNENTANLFGGLNSQLNFNSTNWKIPSLNLEEKLNFGINGSVENSNGFKLDVPELQGLNWGKMNGTGNMNLTGGLNILKVQNNIEKNIEKSLEKIEGEVSLGLQGSEQLQESRDFVKNNSKIEGTHQIENGAESFLDGIKNMDQNLRTKLKSYFQLPQWNLGIVGTENISSGINFQLPDIKGENLNIKSGFEGNLSSGLKDDLKNLRKLGNEVKTELQNIDKSVISDLKIGSDSKSEITAGFQLPKFNFNGTLGGNFSVGLQENADKIEKVIEKDLKGIEKLESGIKADDINGFAGKLSRNIKGNVKDIDTIDQDNFHLDVNLNKVHLKAGIHGKSESELEDEIKTELKGIQKTGGKILRNFETGIKDVQKITGELEELNPLRKLAEEDVELGLIPNDADLEAVEVAEGLMLIVD